MLTKILAFLFLMVFILECSKPLVTPVDSKSGPKLIEKPLFVYPRIARENGLSGKVHLILNINKYGKVDSITIDKSSGYTSLDNFAVAFVKKFKYSPAKLNGKPIRVYVGQTIDYSLTPPTELSRDYSNNVKNIISLIKNASPEKCAEMQNELLETHKEYINSNSDFTTYNKSIKDIVSKNAMNRWKGSISDWPLHFIVFDDFQKRFPNSILIDTARILMFDYLEKDLQTVKIISNIERHLIAKSKSFEDDIHNFIREEYAEVLPDSLDYLTQ